MLRADHETVQELFDRFEKQREKGASRQLQALATEICNEVKIHAQIEEEIFYPAVREHCEGVRGPARRCRAQSASYLARPEPRP